MRTVSVALASVLLLAVASVANAQEPLPTPPSPASTPRPPEPSRPVGVGVKVGDGLGVGADVFVDVAPHFAVDVMATPFHYGIAGGPDVYGFGLAPELQVELKPSGSTPYVGLGGQYATAHVAGEPRATVTGEFANVGYDWKMRWGLGIDAGLGVQHLNRTVFTDATGSDVVVGGDTALNLELGMRYMF